jgi:hypothetical protein
MDAVCRHGGAGSSLNKIKAKPATRMFRAAIALKGNRAKGREFRPILPIKGRNLRQLAGHQSVLEHLPPD